MAKTRRKKNAAVIPPKAEEVVEETEAPAQAVKPKAGSSNNISQKNLMAEVYTGLVEKTVYESAVVPDSQLSPYNPDTLVRKTGDYKIYEEMCEDDQVSILLQLKKDLVIGSGWEIVCDDEEQEEKPDEKTPMAGAEGMPAEAPKPIEEKSFAFPIEETETPEETEEQDPNAEVEETSEGAEVAESDAYESLSDSDPIIHDLEIALQDDSTVPFEDQLEEILSAYEFGFSLTEKVFKLRDDGTLTLKCLKTRHPQTWLIHTDEQGNIEKYEQQGVSSALDIDPKSLIHYVNNRKFQNPYGKSDLRPAYAAYFAKRNIIRYYAIYLEKAAAPTPIARYDKNAPKEAVDAIFEAIKKLQAKTAMAIPKDVEMEYLESKSDGEAYTKGLNIFNMFIGRSMFVPDLMGFQGSETGGGAYNLGVEQFKIFYKHIQRRRERLERIVNQEIIKPIVYYNHGFVEKLPKFRFKPIEDDKILEAVKVWLDAMKSKLYKPSDEEINHFRRAVKFPEGMVERPDPAPMPGALPAMEGGQGSGAPGDPAEANPQPGKNPPPVAVAAQPAQKKSFRLKKYAATPGDYSKRVDFTAVEAEMNSSQNQIMRKAKPLVRAMFNDLYDQMKRKKIVEKKDAEKISTLKVKNTQQLRMLLKNQFRDDYREAGQQAGTEIIKNAKFAALPNDAYLDVLDTETWDYIGDWQYNILKQARVQMIAAIKDGLPISSVIELMNENGLPAALASLERYSRTKTTEVMNRGRLAFFEKSGIVAAYQYSAILDDRTTEICAGLHGKIFKAGDEPIPPLHFNCRSLLIPITQYEDFEVDEKVGRTDIQDFIEENKGDGFSKQ